MRDDFTTLIVTIVGGAVVLFIEYFVPRPNESQRRRILTALWLSLSLFGPLFLFQLISALLVAATMRQRPEVERVDWYANLYAVLALMWGWFWGTKLRPWLRSSSGGRGDK